MRLYYSPGSCSLASNIAFAEAGIAYDMTKVDLAARKTEDGADYSAINDKGYVPFLDLGNGHTISEGAAILQYIADSKPESKLAPVAGTMERVKLNEWLTFINSEVHKPMGSLFDKSMPAEYREKIIAKVHGRCDWLTKTIGDKHYVMGDQFTVADSYLFVVLNWGQWVGVDIGKHPVLAAYQARVAARPNVQAALRTVGLLK